MTRQRRSSGKLRRVLAIVAIAAAAFLLGAVWKGGGGEAAETSMAKPTLWTCSMHPQFQLPDPGKCPICFMDLIPVSSGMSDHEGDGLRELSLSPEAVSLMRIQTSPVERRAVASNIRMVGRVDVDESRIATISAWVPGRLERLFADYTGITVTQGDRMVEFYSPALLAAQEELLQALASARKSDPGALPAVHDSMLSTVDAVRDKLRLWGLTAEQIEEIETRGTAQDRVIIHAPTSGIVIERQAEQGMYVATGTPLYKIADLANVWIHLDAYESDLAWLRDGQRVQFTVEAAPGDTFEGTITFIQPILEGARRTVRVRVPAANQDGRLKPGMFVRATVEALIPAASDPETELPLVIPATAPLRTGTRAVVYVERPDADPPAYEGREVTLGARAGDYYVVAEGLSEGERVVTRGAFKLDAELQLQARPSMMSSSPSPAAAEGSAPGTPPTPHPQTHCPIMGGEINREVFIDYNGLRIYFCCPGCNTAFLNEPEKYLDAMRKEGVEPERVAPTSEDTP